MNLSEKGLQKVQKLCWEYSHNYRKIAEEIGFCDFEPDDFQGAVVLTVEEAIDIICTMQAMAWTEECDWDYQKISDVMRAFLKRIEQVEKRDGK